MSLLSVRLSRALDREPARAVTARSRADLVRALLASRAAGPARAGRELDDLLGGAPAWPWPVDQR